MPDHQLFRNLVFTTLLCYVASAPVKNGTINTSVVEMADIGKLVENLTELLPETRLTININFFNLILQRPRKANDSNQGSEVRERKPMKNVSTNTSVVEVAFNKKPEENVTELLKQLKAVETKLFHCQRDEIPDKSKESKTDVGKEEVAGDEVVVEGDQLLTRDEVLVELEEVRKDLDNCLKGKTDYTEGSEEPELNITLEKEDAETRLTIHIHFFNLTAIPAQAADWAIDKLNNATSCLDLVKTNTLCAQLKPPCVTVMIDPSKSSKNHCAGISPIGLRSRNHFVEIGDCDNLEVTKPIILHELAHTLGMIHTHSRKDRDNNVDILGQNIESGHEFNFVKHGSYPIFNTSYDWFSIMHYGKKLFSKDEEKPTILTKDPKYESVIGKAHDLSETDKVLLDRMICTNPMCTFQEGSMDRYPLGSSEPVCSNGVVLKGFHGKETFRECQWNECRLNKNHLPVWTFTGCSISETGKFHQPGEKWIDDLDNAW